MSFTDRINEAFSEAGITRTTLWKGCSVSSGLVTQWLDGTVHSLSGKNLLKVAILLNVNPEWLNNGKGEKRPGSKQVVVLNSRNRKIDQDHDISEVVELMMNADEVGKALCAEAVRNALEKYALRKKERTKKNNARPLST